MKRATLSVGIGFILGLLHTAAVATALTDNALTTHKIASAAAAITSSYSQTAYEIWDPDSGKSIANKNAHQLFLPASTQKLLTAVAATFQLGKEFEFLTTLSIVGQIESKVLSGDVYVRFNGDPTLTRQNLTTLLSQLRAAGIFHIDGQIFIVGDEHEQTLAAGVVWDDLGICYAAPVSNFIVDGNCLNGELRPSKEEEKGQLHFPTNTLATLTSTAVFDKERQQLFCELSLKRFAQNTFRLDGCFPGTRAVKLAIAINDPVQFVIENVKTALTANQITLSGKVTTTRNEPDNVRFLAQHQSAKLFDLINIMILKSDNLIADSLLKKMGQHYFQQQGDFLRGTEAMRRILTHLGIDIEYAQLFDGSGLSRYNLLTARQLMQVLMLIHRDERFRFIQDTLPIAGVSGTLQYRSYFGQPPLKRQVMAKTGSMKGVANLAGVIRLNQGKEYLFVVLENGLSSAEKPTHPAPFSTLWLMEVIALLEEQKAMARAY